MQLPSVCEWAGYLRTQDSVVIFYFSVVLRTDRPERFLHAQLCKRPDLMSTPGQLVLEVVGWSAPGQKLLSVTYGEILQSAVYTTVLLVDEHSRPIDCLEFGKDLRFSADLRPGYLPVYALTLHPGENWNDAPVKLHPYAGKPVIVGQLLLCVLPEGEMPAGRQRSAVRFKWRVLKPQPVPEGVVITDAAGQILLVRSMQKPAEPSRWNTYIRSWLAR